MAIVIGIPATIGVWNLGALNAGASGSVTFTVAVDSPLANGTTLPSTATLSADLGQPDTATAVVSVSSAPLLLAVKTSDPDQVRRCVRYGSHIPKRAGR